jgi:hypothetical protein
MTFRIFQVTSDGVASPVYRDVDARRDGPPAVVAQEAATAAEEWQRLRQRLREEAATPPPRSGRLAR